MLLTMLMIAVMKTYFSTLTQMTWYQSDKNITCRFLREQNDVWISSSNLTRDNITDCAYKLWGIKNCIPLIGTITLQKYAILPGMLIFGIHENISLPACFTGFCKIENREPAYEICYCFLSSRQQRKIWNSCCNVRPHTSSLQTYGLLTVLTLIL